MSIKNWLLKVFKPLSLKDNKTNKGDNVMSVETEKKEDETLTKAETPQGEETAKGNEVAESQPETNNVENTENTEENQQPNEIIDETEDVVKVEDTASNGNGISIDDLVTKPELADRLSSLEAKFDAILKENQDLKDKLSQMQDKYENKDFGNMSKKGVEAKDNGFETFESYSKQFM